MFSEYASRFLAQSQSRLSLSQEQSTARNPLDRRREQRPGPVSRGFPPRQARNYPYSAAQGSRFPFASKLGTANSQAPLFYSAADDFREEDDSEEHEREVADFYALQRSRRDFGASRMSNSSGSADDDRSPEQARGKGKGPRNSGFQRPQGIRSSWTGDELEETKEDPPANSQRFGWLGRSTADTKPVAASRSVIGSMARTKDHLVDVNLDSTIHEDDEEYDADPAPKSPVDLEDPPSLQKLQRPPRQSAILPRLAEEEDEPDIESVPADVDISAAPDTPRYDSFWSTLYFIAVAGLFATFILVFLHHPAPNDMSALGDTIYTSLHASLYLLAIYTLISVMLALVWLAALRAFVRPLVLLIFIAVPVISIAFSLYPFISSFQGTWHGDRFQDKAMRWLSLLPTLFACSWIYTLYQGRQSFGRAIDILDFATRILAANPALALVGFISLVAVIAWTWAWLLMFSRVFLGGHTSPQSQLFIIDTSSWWLGALFVLVYLWTLGVLAGLQRATTAATVSQWYFHRTAVPQPSSRRVVQASAAHATTTVFGTICFAALLSLLVRLPLLLLPGRFANWITFCMYYIVPTSVAALTNPLTLSYAAIHSQPLNVSAHGLAHMSCVSATAATTTLTPAAAARGKGFDTGVDGAPSLFAFRMAKLLLTATRVVAALAFGFGGWVSGARVVQVDPASKYAGSLYAYIVGLLAAAIGWAVLGAMESVVGGVLDAVVVCWGSEMGRGGTGGARYCREAGELLGAEE